VLSEAGKGSEFWFTARMARQPRGTGMEYRPAAGGAQPGKTFHPPAGRKARVLVAEDNFTNQRVALGILRKLGIHADAVANGKEAIKTLESISYDMVLMDVQMPDMDGLEATRQIRSPQSQVRNPKIPIIAMTAYAMVGDREKCLEAGMNDYVSKPISLRSLAAAVEKWLPKDKDHPGRLKMERRSKPADRRRASAPSVWDRSIMQERLMGDDALTRKITGVFLADIPRRIEALRRFLQTGDARGVQREAHTIKGAAANVGGEILHHAALAMEQAAQASDTNAIEACMTQLESAFDRLKKAMEIG